MWLILKGKDKQMSSSRLPTCQIICKDLLTIIVMLIKIKTDTLEMNGHINVLTKEMESIFNDYFIIEKSNIWNKKKFTGWSQWYNEGDRKVSDFANRTIPTTKRKIFLRNHSLKFLWNNIKKI